MTLRANTAVRLLSYTTIIAVGLWFTLGSQATAQGLDVQLTYPGYPYGYNYNGYPNNYQYPSQYSYGYPNQNYYPSPSYYSNYTPFDKGQ
ncbi:MAG TPA: hypothetical protein VNF99_00265 [Stellaceae bacterium]|nr:hypothetical protein [Stellaceae bacterium]